MFILFSKSCDYTFFLKIKELVYEMDVGNDALYTEAEVRSLANAAGAAHLVVLTRRIYHLCFVFMTECCICNLFLLKM